MDAGKPNVPIGTVRVDGTGTEMASNGVDVRSPETYLGWKRTEGYVGTPAIAADRATNYTETVPRLNQWTLQGDWTVGGESATLDNADGSISYRLEARDLHLVMGTRDGKPVQFEVTVDGRPPGDAHGVDIDAEGRGSVSDHRLYQLVRQPGDAPIRLFKIRFLSPGVQAFAFTFG